MSKSELVMDKKRIIATKRTETVIKNYMIIARS
jgi:hypothetical protein